jgi:hypothetical protein
MSNNLHFKRNLNETKKKPTEKLKQSTTDKDIVMYEFIEDPSFTSGKVNKEVDIIHIEDSFSYIKDDSKNKAGTPKPTTSFSRHGEEEEIVVSEGCRPKEELMQLLEDESFLEANHDNKHLVYENKTDRETYINLDDPAIYSHRQGKKNNVQMKSEQYKTKSAKYQNVEEGKEKWIANMTPFSKAKRDIAILLGHNNTRHQEYLNVYDFGELRDYFDSETINLARLTKISRHKKNQKSKELYTKFKDEIETEFYETYRLSNADDHGYGTRDTFGTRKKQFCEIGVNTEETMTTPRNMLCQNCFASIKDNKINYTMNTHLTTKLKQLEDEINIWKNHNQTYQFDEINKNLRDNELVNADRLDEVNYMLETFRTKQTNYDNEKLRSTVRSELNDTNKDLVRYKETETSKPTRLNYKNIPEADDSKDYSHNISKILRTSRNHYKSNRNSPIRTPKDYSSLSIIEAKIIDKKEIVRNKINEIVKRLKTLKSDYDTDTIFDEEDMKCRYSKIQSNIIAKTFEEESNCEINRENDNVLQGGTSLTFKKDIRKSLELCFNNDYRFTINPVLKKKEYETQNNIEFNIKQKKTDIRKLMKESFERDISTDHFSLTIDSIQNNVDSIFTKNAKTLQITNKKIIDSDSEVKLVNLEISNFFIECSGTIKPKHKISTTTSLYINKNHEKTSSKDLLEISNNLLFSIENIPEPKESSSSIKPIKKVIKVIKKKTTINSESTIKSLQITSSSIECLAEARKLAEYQITNNINDLTISKEEKVLTEGSEPAVAKTKKVIKIIKKKKTDVADLVSQSTESSVPTTNFLPVLKWSGAITESKGQDFSINMNKDSIRKLEITTDINSFTVSKPEIVNTEPTDDGVKKVKKVIKIIKKKKTITASKTEDELQEIAGKLNLDIYNNIKLDIYTNNFELLSQKTHIHNLISSNVVDITVEGIKSDSQTVKDIQTRTLLVRKDSFGKEIVKGKKQHKINYNRSLTDVVNIESYKEFNKIEESLDLTQDKDLQIEEAVSFTIATQQIQKAKKTKIIKVIKKKTTLNEGYVEESKDDLDTSMIKVPNDENKDDFKKQNKLIKKPFEIYENRDFCFSIENYNKSTRDFSICNTEVYIKKLERKPFTIQTNYDNSFTVIERNFAKHNTICYNSLYIGKHEREAYYIQKRTVNIELLKTKATDSNKFMRKIIINKQTKKDKSYTNSEDVSEQSEEELSLKTNNKTVNIVNSERLHTIEEQITPKKENKIIIGKETITAMETNETNTHEGKERTSGLVKRPTMNNTKVVTIKKKQEKEENSEEEEEEKEEVLTVIKPNIKQVNKVLSSTSNDNKSVHSGRNVIKIQRTIVQDDKSESDTETQLKTIVKSKTVVNKTLFARKNNNESESEEEESEEEDAKPIQIKPKYKNISNKGSHSDVQSRKSITEINTHIKINLILQKMEIRRRTRLIKKYLFRWKKPKLGIPSFIDSLKKSNKSISHKFDKTGSLNTSSIMLNLNRSISEEKSFSLNRSLSFKGIDIEASMLNRIVMIFKRQVKGLIYKSFMRWMCQSGVIKMRFNSKPPAKKIKIVKYQFKDGSIKTYPIEVNIANFMWKYTKPLHYYFLRLKQISRKIKEKELQKDADSWTTDYKDIK